MAECKYNVWGRMWMLKYKRECENYDGNIKINVWEWM
jgi:hypothetical protein